MSESKKPNSEEEEVYVDYLKEDGVINGQKFALVSMIEPKNSDLVMNKHSYFLSKFLRRFLCDYKELMDYISKNGLDNLTGMMKEKVDFSFENIQNLYYEYVKLNNDTLEKQFNEKFNPNDEIVLTGFKVRGTYPNKLVLKNECKKFLANEPYVDIYTVPIGKWIPYLPKSNASITEEYAEKKLNNIMKSRVIEDHVKDETFANRKEDALKDRNFK